MSTLAAVLLLTLSGSGAYAADEPVGTPHPIPRRAVDFGPAAPPTAEEIDYSNAMEAGPHGAYYLSRHLGAERCPLRGFVVKRGRTFVLRSDESMRVSTHGNSFRIASGGVFVVQRGGRLAIVPGCD